MEIAGTKVVLRSFEIEHAEALRDLLVANREPIEPFEPDHGDDYFTLERQRAEIATAMRAATADQAFTFGIFEAASGRLVGRIRLFDVSRGAFQNAHISFFVDKEHSGRGFATESVELVLRYAFETAGLHRIEGAVMPKNLAPIRALRKAHFRLEGLAKSYLQVQGVWEDHLIYAITAEDVRA